MLSNYKGDQPIQTKSQKFQPDEPIDGNYSKGWNVDYNNFNIDYQKFNQSTLSKGVDITFKDLNYEVQIKKKDPQTNKQITIQKTILNNVSGICKQGTVTAIMGASGAGKTSLLNVLAKRIIPEKTNNLSGQIMANDFEYQYDDFSSFASYIMQDDRLLESLTVKETLMFTATLKLGKSKQETEQIVDKLIKQIKLERCKNHLVGGKFIKGISGGERKRTSIGIELVSNPHVMFLDEPTSGLDSFTAFLVINQLKQLAREFNKTIIFTIHQPSTEVFTLFDHFMLLVKGNFVYQGPRSQVVDYFSKIGFQCPKTSNPTDYLMSIVHHESQTNVNNYPKYYESYNKYLAEPVKKQIEAKCTQEIQKIKAINSFWKECSEIFIRGFKCYFRDPMLLKSRIMTNLFISIFGGLIFWNLSDGKDDPTNENDLGNMIGFLFFWAMNVFMIVLNPVVLTFPIERGIFLREENSKQYTINSYFWGKSLQEFPMVTILTFLAGLIVFFMTGLRSTSSSFWQFELISLALAYSANSLGLLVGSLFSSPKVAMSMTPIFKLPFILLSGFFINRKNLWDGIAWLQYVSPIKYGLSAFLHNQFDEQNYFDSDPIETWSVDVSMWLSIILLVGMFLLYRILAFISLASQTKRLQ